MLGFGRHAVGLRNSRFHYDRKCVTAAWTRERTARDCCATKSGARQVRVKSL